MRLDLTEVILRPIPGSQDRYGMVWRSHLLVRRHIDTCIGLVCYSVASVASGEYRPHILPTVKGWSRKPIEIGDMHIDMDVEGDTVEVLVRAGGQTYALDDAGRWVITHSLDVGSSFFTNLGMVRLAAENVRAKTHYLEWWRGFPGMTNANTMTYVVQFRAWDTYGWTTMDGVHGTLDGAEARARGLRAQTDVIPTVDAADAADTEYRVVDAIEKGFSGMPTKIVNMSTEIEKSPRPEFLATNRDAGNCAPDGHPPRWNPRFSVGDLVFHEETEKEGVVVSTWLDIYGDWDCYVAFFADHPSREPYMVRHYEMSLELATRPRQPSFEHVAPHHSCDGE